MLNNIILILIFILSPLGILWLCRKVPFLNKIGPILLLYILGVIVGNIPGLNDGTEQLKNIVTSVMIPLAIPLMLFSCSFRLRDLMGGAKALFLGILAAVIATIVGYVIVGNQIPDGEKIAGMLLGCKTGGTINMAALQQMLSVPHQTYVLLNTYDMLVCFFYLMFLMGFGIKWFRKFLTHKNRKFTEEDQRELDLQMEEHKRNPYSDFFTKMWLNQLWKMLLAVFACLGVGYLSTMLFPKNWFMPIFILSITTCALIASFIKPVKKLSKSYDTGLYLIYIFSIAMASMADVTQLNIVDGINTIILLTIIVFGSLFLFVLFAKIFKVEADMVVVASVALVNSPPFVPMIVSAMKNKRVLVPGITLGLIGFAVGNYLGFAITKILEFF